MADLEHPLAALAAVVAGLSGIVSAFVALRQARDEGATDCRDQLARTRAEAERYAAALHRLHLRHPDLIDDDGRSTAWLVLAVVLFVAMAALAVTAWGR